eukprot:CAMPEP_0181375160 /NCGR_PEP_ID=MMETSP1106-20121128/16475_1 /TAXON_ID=81844 /ORGANISM="Mantoniella antarctica, Strain SL-175" /LENGTH=74 /DNA_ID=CAMNT_0023493329 /DNA_START=409 /DNA_END=630 /DNA_ORIENTATION=+
MCCPGTRVGFAPEATVASRLPVHAAARDVQQVSGPCYPFQSPPRPAEVRLPVEVNLEPVGHKDRGFLFDVVRLN